MLSVSVSEAAATYRRRRQEESLLWGKPKPDGFDPNRREWEDILTICKAYDDEANFDASGRALEAFPRGVVKVWRRVLENLIGHGRMDEGLLKLVPAHRPEKNLTDRNAINMLIRYLNFARRGSQYSGQIQDPSPDAAAARDAGVSVRQLHRWKETADPSVCAPEAYIAARAAAGDSVSLALEIVKAERTIATSYLSDRFVHRRASRQPANRRAKRSAAK